MTSTRPAPVGVVGFMRSPPDASPSLSFSPNELSASAMVLIVLSFVLRIVPGLSNLLFPPLKPSKTIEGYDLPSVKTQGLLKITEQDEQKFRRAMRATGKTASDGNPLFLFSLTSPLMLILLSNASLPISPLGSVNTSNEFIFHEYDVCSSYSQLRALASAHRLSYTAAVDGAGVRTRRGVEVQVTLNVLLDRSTKLLTQHLKLLQFLSKSAKPAFRDDGKSSAPEPETASETKSYSMEIKGDDTDAWAASCLDYNPIHISKLGAKLFGQASRIAHGNHVLALACELHRDVLSERKPSSISVKFVKPVNLPARLDFSWTENSLEVVQKGKTRVVARLQM